MNTHFLYFSLLLCFVLKVDVLQSQDLRDKSGIKIGTAIGVDKKQAAVMFFFKGL